MSITMLPIEQCFYEEDFEIVPNFDVLEAHATDFRLMRMQPRSALIASPDTGVKSTDPLHIDKCRQALRVAREQNVDLFVTPEYAIPLALIREILTDESFQPHSNKLWCLCCEGASWEEFNDHINEWGDFALIGRRAIENMHPKNFVGFLLYIFQSQERERLCVVPQSKFHPMREELYVCEGIGLSLGRHIVLLGKERPNRLVTVICADSFHSDVRSSKILFPDERDHKYIVLHPQLNGEPRNDELSAFRNNLYFEECGEHTVYITANWAAGTVIYLNQEKQPILTIRTPWSCIYRRYINYSGKTWLDSLRKIREKNFKHGLGFGFSQNRKLKVWYSHKDEHLQISILRKPYGGGVEINRPHGTVQAYKSYIPNEDNHGWIDSELRFDMILPEALKNEATDDYEYPTQASFEEKDLFYSYCLGHDEEKELLLNEKELSYRVSYHIDEACEGLREVQLNRIRNLILCLKKLGHIRYPSQIKRIQGGFKFQTEPKFPVNLKSKLPHVNEGALVIYVDNEIEMKTIAEQMIKVHGEFIMRDRVCVFATRDMTGEIVHYPVHNDDVTARDRVEQTTDYTQGGLSIEHPID